MTWPQSKSFKPEKDMLLGLVRKQRISKLKGRLLRKRHQRQKKWEEEKLDSKKISSTDIWRTVKGWLGWGTSGTPTQLFWEGSLVTSPRGFFTTMNKFFLDKIKRLRNAIPTQTADPLRRMKEAMQGRKIVESW